MIKATIEYVGFTTTAARRDYVLRSHIGPEVHEYTVGIALAAFTSGRARFQDGPEICYLKLMREITALEAAPIVDRYVITDAELADYVTAHTTPARSRGGFAASSAAASVAASAAKAAADKASAERVARRE
jgi:hypothetical protein